MSSSPEREPLLRNHGGDRYYDDSVINSSNDDSEEIPEQGSQDDDVVFIKVWTSLHVLWSRCNKICFRGL